MNHTIRAMAALAGAGLLSAAAWAQNDPNQPAAPAAQPGGQPETAPKAQEDPAKPTYPVLLPRVPEGPKWTGADIAKVGDMLKGSWKTTGAVAGRAGGAGAEIVMHITPVRLRDMNDAMYVETSRADAPQAPYRRSIFQLYTYKDHIRLRTYEAFTPEAKVLLEQWAGFWACPEFFPYLTADSLGRSGLIATIDLDVTASGKGFTAKSPYAYPNGDGGAVEMTSELTITPDSLVSADRGFDAFGKVVWGSGEGEKYTFARFTPTAPVCEKRDDGLVVLWYKKSKEGQLIDDTQRYYAQYTSWLAGAGVQVDTTRDRDRPGGPFANYKLDKIALGALHGWTAALNGTGVGTHVKLFLPNHYAFGPNPVKNSGRTVVPAGASLVFDVEVVGIEEAKIPSPRELPGGVLNPAGARPAGPGRPQPAPAPK